MKLLLTVFLFISAVFAQNGTVIYKGDLSDFELQPWTKLLGISCVLIGDVSLTINDAMCFSQVVQTLIEADQSLEKLGLQQFVSVDLPNVRKVAGDIPNSSRFIAEFDSTAAYYKNLLELKTKDAVSKVDISSPESSSSQLIFSLFLLSVTPFIF